MEEKIYIYINSLVFPTGYGTSGLCCGGEKHLKSILDVVNNVINNEFNLENLRLNITNSLQYLNLYAKRYNNNNLIYSTYVVEYPYTNVVDDIIELLLPIIRDKKIFDCDEKLQKISIKFNITNC